MKCTTAAYVGPSATARSTLFPAPPPNSTSSTSRPAAVTARIARPGGGAASRSRSLSRPRAIPEYDVSSRPRPVRVAPPAPNKTVPKSHDETS